MKLTKVLLVALLFTCFACDKNNDDTNVTDDMDDVGIIDMNTFDEDFKLNYGAPIQKDIMVSVFDIDGNPIPDVTITVENDNTYTNDDGIAVIKNASVYERFGYIKASKSGFIHASRSIAPTPGVNHVRIMMLAEIVSGSTESGETATITNGAGASVVLNGNYINPNGTAYTGSVDVILHHLDPADEEMRDQMPGMLYAQDEDGEEQGLITLGMLAVELRGNNGEDLNLTPGSTATITMPVDPSIMSYAPPTIPLWYFDEENGVWIEEGEATLVGNEYIGEVSHFSFWNCDIPVDADVICFVLTDQNGNPLSGSLVTITSPTAGTRSGYTNTLGEVCGYLPSNEVLELNVYSDTCTQTSLYNANVGPYSADQTVPITVTLTGVVVTEIVTGFLNDCNATPVSNGYVTIDYLGGGVNSLVAPDGSFEASIIRCTNDLNFTVKGTDIDNLQQTQIQNFNFTTPLTNVGNLLACDTLTEFIEYNLDNGTQTFFETENITADFYPNNNPPSLTIYSYDQNNDSGLYLYGNLMPAPYVGVYDSLDWGDPLDLGFTLEEFFGVMVNDTMVYNLTAIGAVGEYIDISFSGTYDDQGGTPHTLTGTIHVLRDN
ncbi:hypothetical protein SCB49_00260 [unidentified eubacterium SCB49]|nr:hypothetical protein SCB49_00260 [unidentified eubacterium SCB49]